MAEKPAVLITRPAGQGAALCAAFEERGYRAYSEPMLELAALEAPDQHQQGLIAALSDYQHVIFISGNAVRFGMTWLQASWATLPRAPAWHAIGRVTALALQEYGLGSVNTAQEMTSEGLLQSPALQDVAGQRVLIVKGLGGRQRLREQLLARGAEVDELACYRRQCPSIAPGELSRRLEKWHIGLILVSSDEGLRNMLSLLSLPESSKLESIPLIAPSDRVAALARERGFTTVMAAANASDVAMLEAAQGWWEIMQQAVENNE